MVEKTVSKTTVSLENCNLTEESSTKFSFRQLEKVEARKSAKKKKEI